MPLPGGGWICGGRGRRASCSVPGCGTRHTRLCDYPVDRPGRKSKTCDAKLCDRCAKPIGSLDYCPPHAARRADEQVYVEDLDALAPPASDDPEQLEVVTDRERGGR